MGWLPSFQINFMLLFVMALAMVICRRTIKMPRVVVMFVGFQILVWLFYSLIHGLDTSYFTRIFYLVTVFLILEIQVRSKDQLMFLRTYNFWLVAQVVLGTIGFFLVLFGILTPLFEFVEMDSRPGFCFGLFTTNTYFANFVRVAGYFDEPGALACWGIFALLFNKLFFNNKKVEVLLCIGLVTTFSLAYFVQLIAYFVLFYRGSWKRTISLVVLFLGLFFVLSTVSEEFYLVTMGRLQYDQTTGTIEGDNRSDLTENAKRVFMTSPIFGVGARNLQEYSEKTGDFFGANAYTNLATDGIVGYLVVLLPIVYLFLQRKKWRELGSAVIVIAIGLLQRPYDSTQFIFPMIIYTLLLQSYLKIKFDKPMVGGEELSEDTQSINSGNKDLIGNESITY
jgi:hypothetical protein